MSLCPIFLFTKVLLCLVFQLTLGKYVLQRNQLECLLFVSHIGILRRKKSFYREDAHIENAPFLKHSKVLSSFSDRDKQHISDKQGAAAWRIFFKL